MSANGVKISRPMRAAVAVLGGWTTIRVVSVWSGDFALADLGFDGMAAHATTIALAPLDTEVSMYPVRAPAPGPRARPRLLAASEKADVDHRP